MDNSFKFETRRVDYSTIIFSCEFIYKVGGVNTSNGVQREHYT